MRVYRWRQIVTYTVNMLDLGEVDEETGTAMTTPEEIQESAEEWLHSAMPVEYYPEEFVTVDEGPVEFLGCEVTAPPQDGETR